MAGLLMLGIALYSRQSSVITVPAELSLLLLGIGLLAVVVGLVLLVVESRRRPASTFAFRPQVPAYQLTPTEFEHEIARLITLTTPYRAEAVGRAGDRGVDVKVYKGRQLIGIVQCKRFAPDKALAPLYVRELDTIKRRHGVSVAYLATTARFSSDTRQLARQLGINLIDGAAIEAMRAKAATAA